MFFTIEFSDPRFESDNLRHITVKSQHLKGRGDITVFIPENTRNFQNLPLVILLHGVYGSHWAWALKGGVHKTAQSLIQSGNIQPMILAMPSDGLWGDGSGYLQHQNHDFENWIVKDVPEAVRQLTSLYTSSSKTFITGLSMGGFGAMRLGAKYPNVFAGFSGLSSVTKFESMRQFLENEDISVLGSQVSNQENIFDTIIENKKSLRPFRFDCGVEDLLIDDNRHLHEQLTDAQIAHQYVEYEGKHEWNYWEKNIADSLRFFDKI